MVGKGFLTSALLAVGISTGAQALPTTEGAGSPLVARTTFIDNFDTFSTDIWQCEYTCPVIETNKARFRLKSGVLPDNYGSWSKARYKGQRFTSGRFTVSFSLTARPRNQAVWWGIALYDGGSGSGNDFSEINFGYTTDQSFTDSKMWFESTRPGGFNATIPIETGVDLYNEEYRNATLEYDENHVALYMNGKLLYDITDKTVIPRNPMDFILGPRLVTGSAALTEGFTQSVDWVQIEY